MIDLAGFALAVLLIELTPGPNMAWLSTLTLAEGRRAGLEAVAGVALGLAGNAALSVLAASYIMAQDAVLTRAVSVLAAAMMAWLAWEAWAGPATVTRRRSGRRHAWAGFAINLLNPKSALFMITVMPQFVAGGSPSLGQGLVLGTIGVAIATTVHLSLVLLAEHARAALMSETRAKLVRRVLAAAMLGVAVWFLFKAFG